MQGNYDSAEPNDSAFEAYKIKEGELSGASLHVENDQDWYIWDATAEFKSAKFIVSAGYDVEVYTADGNKLKLNPQNPDYPEGEHFRFKDRLSPLGSHSVYLPGPIQFTHYYDIDGIVISSPGVEAYPDVVYYFAYSVYEGN